MPSEIHVFDSDTWRAISSLQYMDGVTPRTITEVHYNDTGTWRQVFGAAIAAEVLAWATAAPSGTYLATDLSVGAVEFTADTSGNFLFQFFGTASGSGTPTSGTYRPGLTGVDPVNYEISINAGTVVGTGTRIAIGSGTLIDGTFQAMDTTRGVQVNNSTNGTTGQISVTVEIREIAVPANTTGPATFTLKADGDGL
jgi:hypothetical protein